METNDMTQSLQEKLKVVRQNLEYKEANRFHKALASGTRMLIIGMLSAAGPLTVGQIVQMTGVSQPTTNRHLSILRNAGLIEVAKKGGKNTFYEFSEFGFATNINYTRGAINVLKTDPSHE